MGHFVELLRTPGLARVIVAQLIARLPAGMTSLGLLMHIEHLKGNYASAGAVLAALSIGMAVAGPVISRQLHCFGTQTVLLACLLLSTASLVPVVLAPVPLWALILLAALGGATIPPVQPTVRTLYPTMVPAHQVQALFSLDAALQEIIWVLGPVLVTTLAVTLGTATAMITILVIQVVGGLLFILDPAVRGLRIPASTGRFGSVLVNPVVLLITGLSILVIGCLAAMEAAVVGTFGKGSLLSGYVLAISAFGSMVGGLAVGHLILRRWSLTLRLVVVAVGMGAATVLSGFWGITAALFVTGLGTAPVIAAMSAIIAGNVDFADTAEAYGWLTTGQLVGAAVGSAAAGLAIDVFGGAGGMATSFTLAALAVVGAAVCSSISNRHPQELTLT